MAAAFLLLLAQAVFATHCPPCGGEVSCPPTDRSAGQPCGGPCDRSGLCAPGLACVPDYSLKARVLARFSPGAQPPGTCVEKEPVHTCVGCATAASPDDEALSQAARWGLGSVSKARNSPHSLEMVRILSASKQVVAGIKYKITMEVGDSSCANDGAEHAVGDCRLLPGDTQLLTVEIVDAPWRTPRYTLLSHKFESAHR